MSTRLILDKPSFKRTLTRLCFQLIENHDSFDQSVIIGLQPRGILLAKEIHLELEKLTGSSIRYGELDTTFFRDDFRQKSVIPQPTLIDFVVENQHVILIDDVLFTGRSVRAALDAIQHFGRPASIELLVLLNRRLSRHVPIQPDYVGITIDAVFSEKVKLNWTADGLAEVVLQNKDE
jgi:pyrimidine operon attenuation protein / uracil phosphoribosyltransferase